jgi:rod shape-determining protein MreC
MNLFLSNNKKRAGFVKILAGVVILFLFVAVLNLFSARIRNFFYFISSPIQSVFYKTGNNTAGLLQSIFNSSGLRQENENLKKENQKLLTQISQLCETQEEGKALEAILEISPQKDFKLVLSTIIGLDSENDFILIDQGKEDGIEENMPIISQEKVLFGKVFKVYKNFSQVMLISNKNSVLDVKVQNADPEAKPVFGAIKGMGGLEAYLDLVPLDSQINQGDILITSALEGIFPKDLLVGKIKEKIKNDLKPFQNAEIDLFLDARKTGKLFVITSYKQEK